MRKETFNENNKVQDDSNTFRIYFNPKSSTYDQFLMIEQNSFQEAAQNKWKIFHHIPTNYIGNLMVCKN